MAEDDTRNEEEEEALDAAAPAEGGEARGSQEEEEKCPACKPDVSLAHPTQKKKEETRRHRRGRRRCDAEDAAEDDADDAAEANDDGEPTAAKKKKKKRSKKKKPTGTGSKEPLSVAGRLHRLLRKVRPDRAAHHPRLQKLFKADAFPVGEIQDYEGGNAKRVTDAEKRSADRMQALRGSDAQKVRRYTSGTR